MRAQRLTFLIGLILVTAAFPAMAATRYWVGGTGTWSDTAHWSDTSGAGGGFSVPTSSDDVFFNGASGAAPYTVTLAASGSCKTLNFTGFAGTFVHNDSTALIVYGSATFVPGMTYTAMNATGSRLQFQNTSDATFDPGGQTFGRVSKTAGGSSRLTLAGDLTATQLDHYWGTFDTNGKTLNLSFFGAVSDHDPSMYLRSSTISLSRNGVAWSLTGEGTWIVFDAGTSTITLTDTSGSAKTFNGGGQTYNNVSISGGGTGSVTFTGDNTFNVLTINSPKTVKFTAYSTTTVADLVATGTSSNKITISSNPAGNAHNLVKSGSSRVICDHLILSDSSASPANIWYAGNNSTCSNSPGWSCTTPLLIKKIGSGVIGKGRI